MQAVRHPVSATPSSFARPSACRRSTAPIRHRQIRAQPARAEAAADQAGPSAAPELPTKLNTIPHPRETRQFFYAEVASAVQAALAAGRKRISVRCSIPELNTEFDVYRVGTLLELVRNVATAVAADGQRVMVCVQQPMGEGVFKSVPLQLNGIVRIMKAMDWGPAAEFISTGQLGADQVEAADAFVLVAPQNIVGFSVLPLVEEMVDAAGAAGKPLVLINPKLGDVQSAGGVMGVRGRAGRIDFAATFEPAYHFRLLYAGASMYPIMGALRFAFGGPWQVYRRAQRAGEGERYEAIGDFESQPGPAGITEAFKQASKLSKAW